MNVTFTKAYPLKRYRLWKVTLIYILRYDRVQKQLPCTKMYVFLQIPSSRISYFCLRQVRAIVWAATQRQVRRRRRVKEAIRTPSIPPLRGRGRKSGLYGGFFFPAPTSPQHHLCYAMPHLSYHPVLHCHCLLQLPPVWSNQGRKLFVLPIPHLTIEILGAI